MDLIRVGAFELYPAERRLLGAGVPIELGARAFDLLLVLVEQHGRLVTKATLLERVWPRVIVDENNLPAQIASLRRALGAGAIRTVPGFGYRLELPVSMPGTAIEPQAPAIALGAVRIPVPRRAWPGRLAPLVGRDRDLQDLQHLLTRAWLVTVVGGAGVGKTRLAQEILVRGAEQPGTALAWVPLHALSDAQHVPSAIALALGLSLPDGVDGYAALHQALEQVPVLLILDGAEHLADGMATPLATLLSRTQGVRALVTSQVPLGIPDESVYRLPVLSVPAQGTPHAEVSQYAAIELFAQRAAAADRRFELTSGNAPLVAEVCRRLDGNPLALELAAARIPALGIAALLERLDDRFRLLKLGGRTVDARHGALHAAFDWSYGLLAPAEQRVFNRLGTFAGSFSLHAAALCVTDEAVDPAEAIDLIGRLVDRSLVTALPVDPPRYALPETARFYALDRLAASQALAAAQQRMAATMLGLLDGAYEEYWSVDEAIWMNRYEAELGNVRAALDWAAANDGALAIALYGSAWPLFVETDLYAEGRERYAQALTQLTDSLPRARIGRFWEAIATYDSTRQSDRARYAAELAIAVHAAAGDARAQYYALNLLACNWQVDSPEARAALAAARQLEDPAWPARLLAHGARSEGANLMSRGQLDEARSAYLRAVRFALTTSERQALTATVHIVELDVACGNAAAALQLARPLVLSLRHSGRGETRLELLGLAFGALLLAGELDEARATGAEHYALALRLDTSRLYSVLDAMALLAGADRRFEAAARITICADLAHEAHGQSGRGPAQERMRLAVAAILEAGLGSGWRGHAREAREQLNEATACALGLGLSA